MDKEVSVKDFLFNSNNIEYTVIFFLVSPVLFVLLLSLIFIIVCIITPSGIAGGFVLAMLSPVWYTLTTLLWAVIFKKYTGKYIRRKNMQDLKINQKKLVVINAIYVFLWPIILCVLVGCLLTKIYNI